MDAADHERPTLRIVHGSPSAEELAVLTALLAASPAGSSPAAAPAPSRWAAPASRMRRSLRSGPDAWAWSLRR